MLAIQMQCTMCIYKSNRLPSFNISNSDSCTTMPMLVFIEWTVTGFQSTRTRVVSTTFAVSQSMFVCVSRSVAFFGRFSIYFAIWFLILCSLTTTTTYSTNRRFKQNRCRSFILNVYGCFIAINNSCVRAASIRPQDEVLRQ